MFWPMALMGLTHLDRANPFPNYKLKQHGQFSKNTVCVFKKCFQNFSKTIIKHTRSILRKYLNEPRFLISNFSVRVFFFFSILISTIGNIALKACEWSLVDYLIN